MDITGKIIKVMPEVSGTSKNGNSWKKREYVLETEETYPKRVFFNFFNDRADQYPLQEGQIVKLFFDIDSHEYNGRWFTEIRGWKIEDPGQQPAPTYNAPATGYSAPAPAPAPVASQPIPPMSANIAGESATDDLPF